MESASPAPGSSRPSDGAGFGQRVLLRAIGLYQRFGSPILGGHCRYLPSCSEYAAMAIKEWGALRGSLYAIWRLLRCNPFGGTGLDLPPRRHAESEAPPVRHHGS